jgi:hypothetical protein
MSKLGNVQWSMLSGVVVKSVAIWEATSLFQLEFEVRAVSYLNPVLAYKEWRFNWAVKAPTSAPVNYNGIKIDQNIHIQNLCAAFDHHGWNVYEVLVPMQYVHQFQFALPLAASAQQALAAPIPHLVIYTSVGPGLVKIFEDQNIADNEIKYSPGIHGLSKFTVSKPITYSSIDDFVADTYAQYAVLVDSIWISPNNYAALKNLSKLTLPDVATAPKAPVCECGAHKCNSNIHSTWCKLFSGNSK